MNANENKNSTVLENRDYRNHNPNSVNENAAVSEDLYEMDEFKSEREDLVANNDYNPENPNPDQITNDDDDFLDTDYPEDDDVEEEDPDDVDLEEEAEESINQPGEDFNETEEFIEDPEEEDEDDDYEDYQEDEEDFPEEDPGKF